MKKVAVIIFTLFYAMVSIGMPMNIHFCHGEVKDLAIFSQTEDCCPEAGNEVFTCCEKSFLQIMIEDGQTVGTNLMPASLIPVVIHTAGIPYDDLLEFKSPGPVNDLIILKPPAFLLNCSLVFYG